MHSSSVVDILFNTDLYKAAFSTYYFQKLILFYFRFDDIFDNICVIIVL